MGCGSGWSRSASGQTGSCTARTASDAAFTSTRSSPSSGSRSGREGCGPGSERGRGLAHGGLLAMERECQAGDDEGQEKDRQDALAAAPEAGSLALGNVEGLGSAGVPAGADLHRVTSRSDRYFDGLVQFQGPGTLAVDDDVVRAAADFHSDGFGASASALRTLLVLLLF